MESTEHNKVSKSAAAGFEQASFNTLLVTIVLGVLIFAPPSALSLSALKTVVIAVGALISAIFFILARIKSKSFGISLHPIIWTGTATALVVLLATIFSPSISSSLFGKTFSDDVGAFLLVLFMTAALTFALVKGHANRVFWIFSAILGSFSLLAIYHILRLCFGAGFLSFGTFTSVVYTTVGTWHDLGVFAALALVISFITLQLLPMTGRLAKGLFIGVFALASILLIVVDLRSVWILVVITMLAFTVYKYLAAQKHSRKPWNAHLPIFGIVVTVLALIFAWGPKPLSSLITDHVLTKSGAFYSEVSLPWRDTTGQNPITEAVVEATLKTSPIFGAGPGRFVNQYLKYKPEIVNATQFWATDFGTAGSFMTTLFVTQGILGSVLWLLSFLAFIGFGGLALMRMKQDEENAFARYGLAASYFGGGLLWISLATYMPQHAVLALLFVLSGVLAAHVVTSKGKAFHFSEGMFAIPALVIMWVLIAACAIVAIFFAKNAVAEIYFERAVNGLNSGTALSTSAQQIQSALRLNKSDVYYQAISQMDIFAVSQIVSNATSSTPDQATVQLIGGLMNDGIQSARYAQNFDATNPYNYLSEAQVAVTAAGLGIAGAYEDATSSYGKALALDPLDPSIFLGAAKLELFEKNINGAEGDLNIALQIKPDYTDALFEAGIVAYETKDYATALKAFTAVQQYDSSYANIQQAINLAKAAGGSSSQASLVIPTASSTESVSGTASATSTTPAKSSTKAK